MKREFAYYLLCLAIGIVAVFVRLVYSFLPLGPVTETVVFGALGWLVSYMRPERYWRWIITIIIPPLLYVALILRQLGVENLEKGIGAWWALSVVLIPLAAFVGGFLGAKLRTKRGSALSTAGTAH